MPRIPRAAYTAALHRAKGWLKRPDVTAVGIGLQKQGDLQTDTKCISVTVRWKRTTQRLATLKIEPLPHSISVRVGGRTHKVPVDVEGAGGRIRGKLHGIVGAQLKAKHTNRPGAEAGLVGAIVEQQGRDLILAAGHVVLTPGARVSVRLPQGTLQGTAAEVFLENSLDHALVEPSGTLPDGASNLPNGESLGGVRDTSRLNPREQAFYYDQDGRLHSVRVDGTNVSTSFPLTDTKELAFDDLIAVTPAESREGDSGTILYDIQFLAIGTLVGGYNNRSYFLPCDISFTAIGVTLV